MPIEVGLWKMGEMPQRVEFSALEMEKHIEQEVDLLRSEYAERFEAIVQPPVPID